MKRFLCFLIAAACLFGGAALAESWAQINQAMQKAEDWREIVGQSAFQLGEVTENSLGYLQQDFGTYPSMDGSTVSVPMAVEFARQHLKLSETDIAGFVAFSTTHNAYENLIYARPNRSSQMLTTAAVMDEAHPIELFIGTEPSDEERLMAQEAGVTLQMQPVCFDTFVFIAHADNPINSLTVEQIRGIYTDQIKMWSELGVDSDEEIVPYQRLKNSGSQTAMENMVMQGEPMSLASASVYYLGEMSQLVDAIGNYENRPTSIGYTYKYYIDTLYKSDAIKIIKIDGVEPTDENVRSGAYPFSTNYYAVYRGGDEEKTAGQFVNWMMSEEGRQCIAQAGYIPYMPLKAGE